MIAGAFVHALDRIGVHVGVRNGKLLVRSPTGYTIPDDVIADIRSHRAALLHYAESNRVVLRREGVSATTEQDPRPLPFLNERGELIVPWNADVRYRWWDGGQSVQATLEELDAPPEIIRRYVAKDLTRKV